MDVDVGERAPVAPSFDDWVEVRVAGLLRFAVLLTGDRTEAEDAVQTALERALVRWDRVARTGDPETYVRRMVINAHISLWRRGRRREWPVAEVRTTEAADPTEGTDSVDAVRRLCARLPRVQRAAVVLRFYEDRSYAEIAELLGCAEATARSHVHRALVALRKELGSDA